MTPLILIACTLLFGFLFQILFSKTAQKALPRLNYWCLRIALPALVLEKMRPLFLRTDFKWNSNDSLLLISQPWIHAVTAALIILIIARTFKWTREVTGAIMLTLALGNTSFVGFPLLRATLGEESIPHAIFLDQLGSFLILSSVAIPLAILFSPRKTELQHFKIFLRIISFPPLLALFFSYFFASTQFGLLETLIHFIATSLAPVAVFSVGLSLHFQALSESKIRQPLIIGLFLKLLILPAIYFLVYSSTLLKQNADALVLKTIILEASMASMITSGIVASENGFETSLAQLMVGLSVVLSLLTVPLLSRFI